MRPLYTLSIDEELSEDGKYLGVLEIANTATPAIRMTGVAFSSHVTELTFKDDLKYRIAAPVLMPSIIYRKDPETGEEYDVKVTGEVVEQMFVRFQKDRAGKDIFNEEHNEGKRVPSYPLEMWMVENPKLDKSYTTYGVLCPEKTWFCVQQFTSPEAYFEAVDKGQLGFSIHGEGVLKLSEQLLNSDTMIETEVTLPEGAVFEIEGKKYTVKDGVVVPVVEEEAPVEMAEEAAPVEMTEEEPKEEEVEMAAEETPEPEAVEAVDTPQGETYTKEEIDARFQEMMDIIAEMKAAATPVEMEEATEPNVQMSAPKSDVQKKMDLISAWNRGKEVMANFKNK